ncbi:hypothetical protein [Mycolicibacterium sp.]|uniref:hypothetical protein n=1 Tax=Mycolicibacterium sp. TaxID=2320850 RepID=UPI0025E0E180|nr:hypothetical protein [Mycolicibacterium sp.]MCB9408785.1 hypothetical protein [Mycolicibacterium sp.]
MEVQDNRTTPPGEKGKIMKNLGFSAIVFGGIALPLIRGPCRRRHRYRRLRRHQRFRDRHLPWYATSSTPAPPYGSLAATIVPWADAVNDNDADSQP